VVSWQRLDHIEAQTAHRQRFKRAAAYAKAARDNSYVRAHHEMIAQQLGKRPWDAAFSDYMQENDLF
jgi:hypothetical protein